MGLENVLLTGKIIAKSDNLSDVGMQITVTNGVTIQTQVLNSNGQAIFIVKGQETYTISGTDFSENVELGYGDIRTITIFKNVPQMKRLNNIGTGNIISKV